MIPTHKPSRLLRYLPRFFATLLHVLILPTVVQAQFDYTTIGGTVAITGYTGLGGPVTIPGTINGLPVTRIGEAAFEYNTSLTSITIPNSVTSIGDLAFYYCTSLTSVTIPNSVTSIGNEAFSECRSLTAITVDVLNSIYSSLDGVLFNKSQTLLILCPGKKAGTYTIPNSVTNIGELAFAWCANLTSVTIPDSVTSIGQSAFHSCTSLTGVTIPNGVTSIENGTFSACTSLTSVTIPNSVTSIEDFAFFGCRSLTSVTIPDSVTSIGDYEFSGCTSLTRVYFQGNAPNVDESVFQRANNVTVYYLPGTTGWGSTFGDRPTAPWLVPNPLILNNGPCFGLQTNVFGFVISWATNISVVVEATTNLSNPAWTPVGTNTLTGGSSYFSDPEWTNHPARFYRLRSP
jgi:hypothetical protein